MFFSSFRRIAAMPRGSCLAEIGSDVCSAAYVDILMAARRTRTTRYVWIAPSSAAGVPPVGTSRRGLRWLAKCGAAQTGPFAAPAPFSRDGLSRRGPAFACLLAQLPDKLPKRPTARPARKPSAPSVNACRRICLCGFESLSMPAGWDLSQLGFVLCCECRDRLPRPCWAWFFCCVRSSFIYSACRHIFTILPDGRADSSWWSSTSALLLVLVQAQLRGCSERSMCQLGAATS